MSESEKLNLLRAMVGTPNDSEWTDEILKQYLLLAGHKIISRAYPYNDSVTEVPGRYASLQCEIAAYMLNKRGAEGELSHSENGISRSYESADVPESLLGAVTPYCSVIGA